MKIKIDENGELLINGKAKHCPFLGENELYDDCGDWCALFGEPERMAKCSPDANMFITIPYQHVEDETNEFKDSFNHIAIQLCHKTLICKKEDFEDLRIVKSEK